VSSPAAGERPANNAATFVADERVRSLADEIVRRAIDQAGLSDFGSNSYREGLERHIDALLATDVAKPDGRERSYVAFTAALVNRLRITQYVKEHPDVLERPIARPLMVMGLPRSGTTMVSYMLDRDPRRRSLLQWEAFDSVPPPTTATLRTDERCQARLRAQEQAARASGMLRLHVEWANGPTEDLALHGQDFKALLWEQFGPVPRYMRWLIDEADMTSAYEYERRALQVLQSRAPGAWQLKQPSHALFVDTLLDVFPDARLVWTHRDPYKTAGSLFSLMSNIWMASSGVDGQAVLREHYPHYLAEHLNRPLRVRQSTGPERIFDLYYADLMRDPIGQMRKLYEWAEDDFTAETEAGMRDWCSANPQGRFGRHVYELAQFGVSVRDLEPWFANYLRHYDVEPEGFDSTGTG
jgi:hypothetical protein